MKPLRVGIFHPADPAGHIPGGIDSIIRGIMKWAPDDLEYTLYGASSDLVTRPVGKEIYAPLDNRFVRYIPIVGASPSSRRAVLPLTVRYLWALRRYRDRGLLAKLDVLDFHRIEGPLLFSADPRAKSLMIHMDMAVLRDKNCDIGWRHAPWLYEALERQLFPSLQRVYCVRQTAIERYRGEYPQLAERFVFIPTWVDTDVFKPAHSAGERMGLRRALAADLGFAHEDRIIVSVGRLDRQKDPLLLLESFQRALAIRQNLRLLLIGDGVLRSVVEQHCRSTGLTDRVRLLGARSPAYIAELLRAADLFALSSAYEGMPVVVLEALACGTPVVTTDVGEVRLTVRSGENGAVLAERSSEALAMAIHQCLEHADSLRGEPCLKAVEPYRPERVLERVYDFHRQQGTRRAG